MEECPRSPKSEKDYIGVYAHGNDYATRVDDLRSLSGLALSEWIQKGKFHSRNGAQKQPKAALNEPMFVSADR